MKKIHLDEIIEGLRKNLIQMATIIKESLDYSIKSFFEGNKNLAETVIKNDSIADSMENKLDEEALAIFALQQPIAIDLRFVVMVLKINNDLERIGDLAVNISERTIDLIDNKYYNYYDQLINFAEINYISKVCRDMVDLSIDALINKDVKKAREVIKKDLIVDSYNKSIILKCISEIKNNPESTEFFINIITISKSLERIADHTTNISEDIIYMVEGENIKHSEKKFE
ncbi:MAG TPA: phosphate signaling complex protein PhoU [Spirochaetota bacterium]|nr:phosphate signaling complex protein PhoU [Spirochaetota bacterium]HOM37843.1 phosphate signaling complex protein PhoU [Spirochaetota bacterium]HPQ49280.1 phosphate signaling complex protein PhoU [Spirochaetota bacterium]